MPGGVEQELNLSAQHLTEEANTIPLHICCDPRTEHGDEQLGIRSTARICQTRMVLPAAASGRQGCSFVVN